MHTIEVMRRLLEFAFIRVHSRPFPILPQRTGEYAVP